MEYFRYKSDAVCTEFRKKVSEKTHIYTKK